jgi:hypothetical protein
MNSQHVVVATPRHPCAMRDAFPPPLALIFIRPLWVVFPLLFGLTFL